MSELIDSLNPEQRRVALHRGHCLAIACPGAGKTKTLAVKAANLLDEGERVCAVTFTKDAAYELRARTVSLAQPGANSRLLVGTFHSVDLAMAFPGQHKGEFGHDILAKINSPFKTQWKIIQAGVRAGYIDRAIREAGLSYRSKDASALIELAKESDSIDHLEDGVREMVVIYQQLMAESGHVDFQDIILKTNQALRDGTLSPLPVHHLLIDEFQDTDKSQFEWAALHAKKGIAVTVVGDDDQSIYGFRRALGFQGMERFATEFGALRVVLGTNYRCHREILGAAEKLIRHNGNRIDKSLIAHKGAGGVVSWETFGDTNKEYAAVAEEAFGALQENLTFAAIARTNDELAGIQAAMISRGVPYRKTDGKSIFDCHEVQVYGALLRTVIEAKVNDVDQVLAWAGMNSSDSSELRRMFGAKIIIGSKADFAQSKMSQKGIELWRAFAQKHAAWVNNHAIGLYTIMNFGIWEWLNDHLQKPSSPGILLAAQKLYEVHGKRTLREHLDALRAA